MRFFSLLPALCLISSSLAAPISSPDTISKATLAEPKTLRSDVEKAWKELENAYDRLSAEFKRVRPTGNQVFGAYGRSGVPAAHNVVLDTYRKTGDDLSRLIRSSGGVGGWDAAMLFSPAWQLLRAIQATFAEVRAEKTNIKASGESGNVRTMFIDQQRIFKSWSSELVNVLPKIQQPVGNGFINEVNREYDGIIREF